MKKISIVGKIIELYASFFCKGNKSIAEIFLPLIPPLLLPLPLSFSQSNPCQDVSVFPVQGFIHYLWVCTLNWFSFMSSKYLHKYYHIGKSTYLWLLRGEKKLSFSIFFSGLVYKLPALYCFTCTLCLWSLFLKCHVFSFVGFFSCLFFYSVFSKNLILWKVLW